MKFAEAQKKAIDYLQSDEFQKREDAETTLKSVKTLVEIIKAGFVSENSQEGEFQKGFNKESGNYYQIKERAYLTGFMKKKEALAFLDRMNENTDKVAFVIQATPGEEYAEGRIVVTASRSGKHLPLTSEFEGFTFLRTSLPESTIDFLKKQAHINKSESVVYVACFDPEYGRQASGKRGLYGDVLRCLKN